MIVISDWCISDGDLTSCWWFLILNNFCGKTDKILEIFGGRKFVAVKMPLNPLAKFS